MQRHPHPQLGHLPADGALRLQRRRDAVFRGGERGAKGIADRLEDVAVVALDSGTEKAVMAGEVFAHRLGMMFPETGAALDVGEEECHRS